jgi:hypothetical protein
MADVNASSHALTLQIGDTADDFNKMSVSVDDMSAKGLGLDGLRKVGIMTEADAKEQYENNVKWEAEILVDNVLPLDMPTDAVYERAEEVIAKIYSYAKYTVADAEKLKSGDLAVEVTVSPIEIIPLLTDDFMQQSWYDILDDNGIETQDQMDALSDDEYQVLDEKYAMVLLDELERLIDDLTYGEDQVIMLQMKKDSDGYYTLVESGWQKLDEVMIDYSGTYAK